MVSKLTIVGALTVLYLGAFVARRLLEWRKQRDLRRAREQASSGLVGPERHQ